MHLIDTHDAGQLIKCLDESDICDHNHVGVCVRACIYYIVHDDYSKLPLRFFWSLASTCSGRGSMSSLTGLLRKRRLQTARAEVLAEAAPVVSAATRARIARSPSLGDEGPFNLSSDEELDSKRPSGGFLLRREHGASKGADGEADFGAASNVYPSIRWIVEPVWCSTGDVRARMGAPSYFPDAMALCAGLGMDALYAAALKLPLAARWRMADIDPASVKWLTRTFPKAIIYKSNRAMIDDCVARKISPKIIFCGGSCQPYSDMRKHQMRAVPPHRHKFWEVTFGERGCEAGSFLEALEVFRPETAVFENVMGFDRVVSKAYDPMLHADGATWADVLLKKVSLIREPSGEQRYALEKFVFQTEAWVDMSRTRLVEIAKRFQSNCRCNIR